MNPWVALLLFFVGNILIGSSVMMLVKGHMPPPLARMKARPEFATLLLLVGMTMLMHFGWPELLNQLLGTLGG